MDEVKEAPAERLPPPAADHLKQSDISGRLAGLRGMAWAYGVLLHTGYTASGASKRFAPSPENGREQSNSKLMYQYLKGDRAPTRGARGKYGFDLVAAVDAHPRGRMARKWLDHPLWMIFDEHTTGRDLEQFLEEDVYPPSLAEFSLCGDIPPIGNLDERQRKTLELQIFDDFVCVCAFFRLGHLSGYKGAAYSLVEYLVPQASKIEPIFGYVHAPFLKMVRDFYL